MCPETDLIHLPDLNYDTNNIVPSFIEKEPLLTK